MEFLENYAILLKTQTVAFTVLFFILGACLASFFNVVIFRLPKMIEEEEKECVKEYLEGMNIVVPDELKNNDIKTNLSHPASHCYSCGNKLKWYHNIPILSYLVLRGKCGFCKTPYSFQYPLVEALGGIILAATYLLFIPSGVAPFLLAAFLFMMCFVMAGIDLKTYLLPDSLTLPTMWIGLTAASQNYLLKAHSFQDAFLGAVVGYGLLWFVAFVGKKIKKQEVMGEGDWKLLAALGVFIGVKGVIIAFFVAPFMGIFTWLYFRLTGNKEAMVPYGPSLILASVFYLFWGEQFLQFLGIR